MIVPHFYHTLDETDHMTVEVPMRQLAELVGDMTYGVHRLLSHIIAVRREKLDSKIEDLVAAGDYDVAAYVSSIGDQLAEGIAELLNRGLH